MRNQSFHSSDAEAYREFIARELQNLSRDKNYPINANIGTHCVVEAFRSDGFQVGQEEDNLIFRGEKSVHGRRFSLETTITIDQLSRGFSIRVPSSWHAFYDGIHTIYDGLVDGVARSNRDIDHGLELLKVQGIGNVRDKMRGFLHNYFLQYQEHMFVPVKGRDRPLDPEKDKPGIFNQVVRNFPWDLLYNAKRVLYGQGVYVTPTVETLVTEYSALDPADFIEDTTDVFLSGVQIKDRNDKREIQLTYHPSENVLDELFLGMYLLKLARAKGYGLNTEGTERELLAYVCGNNFHALKPGRTLFVQNIA